MHDTELYRHLLGIEEPWTVTKVKLDILSQQVDVWVEHEKGHRWACPECGVTQGCYDHSAERTWRHLDSCQFKTLLHASPPRIKCPDHGVRQVALPWAGSHSRFTLMFENFVIAVIQATRAVEPATHLLRISWDEAWGIMERAVERGQAAKEMLSCEKLGVDEKSIAKGHNYFTIVSNLDRGTVEYIAEDRKQTSLDAFYDSLTSAQLSNIKAVAMDMWEPFINSTLSHVPQADSKIVFDRYHVAAHMGKAVDKVRRQEHLRLKQTGDNTLAGSKYIWLYSEQNLPEKYHERFAMLKRLNLNTGRAWALKETLKNLWRYSRHGWAERFWEKWYFWATHSKLTPVIKVAKMINKHIKNILTYIDHHITNAMAEGINSTIQNIKTSARGFRNKKNFKTAIFFHCGGLQLTCMNYKLATHGNAG